MPDELPEGWATTRLADVAWKVTDGSHAPPPAQPSGCIMISAKNIDNGELDFDSPRYINEAEFQKEDKRSCIRQGDILLTIVGAIGRSVVVPPKSPLFTVQRSVAVIKTKTMDPYFLSYQFRAHDFQAFLTEKAKGTAQKGVYLETLSNSPIVIPPLPEQRRIVARIEALQARSQKAREALEAVGPLLEQLRQSVLAAAFRGDLTADWRAKHPRTEPANVLLERIRQERRQKWEAANPKKKYHEPEPVDESDSPELPEGWCWATIGEISSFITSGSRGWAEYYCETGSLFIRSQDINADILDLSKVARVTVPNTGESQRTGVIQWDMLLTITGANVGKCAIANLPIDDAFISQHVALIRFVFPQLANYIHFWVTAANGGRKRLLNDAYGNGKPGLNLKNIRDLHVPVAPLDEQRILVDKLQSYERSVLTTNKGISEQVSILKQFDQSILAKAFRGELVPQNPNDEPASVLLERIRAEREAAEKPVSKRKPRTPR